ncbi:MAG: DUF456 domain-containing protein [Deltaproteobacteria bacterium]|nr:DUF456 domain-containing protein [Deltaproteobacteria bacterium]
MTPLEITGLSLFILILFAGIFSIIFGIPGTIIILIDVIMYAFVTGFEKIGIPIIAILIAITILAEGLEFVLGISGAAQLGITKRIVLISALSSLAGAMILTPVFFGLGAVMGIFLGGFACVLMFELLHQSKLKPALRSGYSALLGRVAGTLAKGFFALVMIIITMSNIYS